MPDRADERLASHEHRRGRHLAQPSHARALGLRKGFFHIFNWHNLKLLTHDTSNTLPNQHFDTSEPSLRLS